MGRGTWGRGQGALGPSSSFCRHKESLQSEPQRPGLEPRLRPSTMNHGVTSKTTKGDGERERNRRLKHHASTQLTPRPLRNTRCCPSSSPGRTPPLWLTPGPNERFPEVCHSEVCKPAKGHYQVQDKNLQEYATVYNIVSKHFSIHIREWGGIRTKQLIRIC